MRALVSADDTGGIKQVICSRGTDSSKKDGQTAKSIEYIGNEEGISHKSKVMFMSVFKDEFLVCVRLGGTVSVYSLKGDEDDDENSEYNLVHTYELEAPEEQPISMVKLEAYNALIVTFNKGTMYILKPCEKQSHKPLKLSLPDSENIEDFVNDPFDEGVFAYGGKECDVKVIRLFEASNATKAFGSWKISGFKTDVLFKAKNVKNDHLNLRVPIWITKIQFMKERKEKAYSFVTATGFGQIRIYDTFKGRRPVADYKLSKTPIRNLGFSDDSQQEVIITDTHNLMAKYSLKEIDANANTHISASAGKIVKPSAKLLGKFSEGGNTGAIKSIHVLHNYIACGGLDRYLRVFDVNSRELVAKVYIGVEITSTLLLSVDDEDEDEDENEDTQDGRNLKHKLTAEEEEEETEEIWDQLTNETAQSESKRRRI